MNKTAFLLIAIFILLFTNTGCSMQSNIGNDNKLDTEDSTNNSYENITVDYSYNSWITTSESEYAIIENNLYGRGKNSLGLFGKNVDDFCDTWIKIAENVKHIEANNNVLLYLTYDGNIYGAGNFSSNIFHIKNAAKNKKDLITTPVLIESNCQNFSLGNEFVIAIKNDNTLWFWGESKNGQSTKIVDIIPHPVKIANNIQFVKAFGYTAAWIDFHGNLYLCGDNSFNQIGNGKTTSEFSEGLSNIVTTPFCALKRCNFFDVSNDMLIRATTIDGKEFIWGNYHSQIPTERSEEFPPKADATDFSKGITMENKDNVLRKKDYPIVFYKEKDDRGNLSIISKSSNLDKDRKIVKSNLTPPFTIALIGNSITISSQNDDSLYLLTYNEISGGQINNIKFSLLYEKFAVPVYVKDSNHLVLAIPQSYHELILDTHSGTTEKGEIWNYTRFDNKPYITQNEAETIALQELSKKKYCDFDNQKHDFSNIRCVSLVFQPSFKNLCLNSWITPNSLTQRKTSNWCYHIKISDTNNELNIMNIFIDADTGTIYSIINEYNKD